MQPDSAFVERTWARPIISLSYSPWAPFTMQVGNMMYPGCPHTHTHTHAYTCCRYKVMAIIIHTGECSCEESAGSSLCPVTTTWPRSPLTTMKNTFGWKIPLLHIHIHTQSNLYSSGHFNLQIQTESPHCSHYHLINSISSTALWHFMIPFSVCML